MQKILTIMGKEIYKKKVIGTGIVEKDIYIVKIGNREVYAGSRLMDAYMKLGVSNG